MDKRILDKIKKLMALAGSNNPHEAANALRKAQLLMQEHQLSEADVELSAITEQSAAMANSGEKQPKWSLNLMAMIQQAFGVTGYFSTYQRRCFFVGYQSRAEIAAYCYAVLARQIKSARRDFLALQTSDSRQRPKPPVPICSVKGGSPVCTSRCAIWFPVKRSKPWSLSI